MKTKRCDGRRGLALNRDWRGHFSEEGTLAWGLREEPWRHMGTAVSQEVRL